MHIKVGARDADLAGRCGEHSEGSPAFDCLDYWARKHDHAIFLAVATALLAVAGLRTSMATHCVLTSTGIARSHEDVDAGYSG